jgi:hypothetical protein
VESRRNRSADAFLTRASALFYVRPARRADEGNGAAKCDPTDASRGVPDGHARCALGVPLQRSRQIIKQLGGYGKQSSPCEGCGEAVLRSTGIIQPLHATDEPTDESLMFGKGEIPVIIFGILFAMLFIFAAGLPQTTVSEHRNYTDTLQRIEDHK